MPVITPQERMTQRAAKIILNIFFLKWGSFKKKYAAARTSAYGRYLAKKIPAKSRNLDSPVKEWIALNRARSRPINLSPYEWKKTHHSCTFYSAGFLPLMLCANSGITRIDDFRLTRNKAAQGGRVAIINNFYVLRTKDTLFHGLKWNIFRFYFALFDINFGKFFLRRLLVNRCILGNSGT